MGSLLRAALSLVLALIALVTWVALLDGRRDFATEPASEERVHALVLSGSALGLALLACVVMLLRREILYREKREQALRLAGEQLEELVAERTAALQAANALLKTQIGERTAAAEAFLLSEQRLHDVLEALPTPVYTTDLEGRVTLFNKAAAIMAGREPRLGVDLWCVSWKLYRKDGSLLPLEECPMAITVRDGRPVHGCEIIAERPDGSRVHLIPHPSLLRNALGTLVGAVNVLVDITERTATLEKLRVQTQMLHGIGQAVVAVDAGGLINYWNRAATQVYGWKREEVLGRRITEVIAAELSLSERHSITGALGLGRTWAGELVLLRKDRSSFPALTSISPVFSGMGKLIGSIGISADLTERKQLDEVSAHLAAVVESSDDAIITKAFDGKITSWNRGAERLFGYSQAETVGRATPLAMTPGEQCEEQGMAEQIRGGQSVTHFETRRHHKHGSLIDVSFTVSPIRDAQGRVTGISEIVRDITRRKQVEKALQESEARMRQVLDTLFAFVAVLSPDGTLLEINRAPLEASGFSAESVLGRKFWECPWWTYCPELQEQIRESCQRGARGETVRFDLVAQGAPGELSHVDFMLAPMRDSEGCITHLIPSGVDITERKHAEEALHWSESQYRTLNAELEKHVAARTFQLRTANKELRAEFDARRRLEKEILEISEREQCRLGQDLHDGLGQQLAGIALLGTVLAGALRAENHPSAPAADEIATYTTDTIATTRSLARGLYPVELSRYGLLVALEDLANQTTQRFRVPCELRLGSQEIEIPTPSEIHLYRIIQESISNAIRHGKAGFIVIEADCPGGTPTFVVRNDGLAFERPAPGFGGLGLHIMDYRARLIGAHLEVRPGAQGGCEVICTIGARTETCVPAALEPGPAAETLEILPIT